MVPVSVPGGGLLGQLFSVDVPVRTAALGTRRQRCFWRSLLLPVSLHRFSVSGREKEREERERARAGGGGTRGGRRESVPRGTLGWAGGIKSGTLIASLSSWEPGRRSVEQGLLESGGRAFWAVCVVVGVRLTLKSLSLGGLFCHLMIRSPDSGNLLQPFRLPWLLVYSLRVGTSPFPTPDPLSFLLCPALCPGRQPPHPAAHWRSHRPHNLDPSEPTLIMR